ncbi:unnamed protein product [Heterobilharzia americana]|nr:unnamed protein product [Heterobilharzia americana]
MGVPGLWRLLEPARVPIELQQLSDMNIWLHQAVKSRGASGGPRNYLAIFFRRLCKLLFFGIRPVFVFDGDTPALKRATMNARRQLRSSTEAKAEKAQKHFLRRLLRRVAESTVKSSSLSSNEAQSPETLAKEELLRRLKQQSHCHQAREDAELFSAPNPHSESNRDKSNSILLSENAGVEYDELAHDFLDGFNSSNRKFSEMDLNSDSFCSLPLPAQLRVVQMAREVLDSSSCRSDLVHENNEATFDPEKFSDVQTKRLLLRRRLAERQQQLSDDLTKQEAVQQVLQLDNSMIRSILQNRSLSSSLSCSTVGSTETIATAMRIQSQDVGHAILVKQSPVKHSNKLTRVPSSTIFDLEKLITYDLKDLNEPVNIEEGKITKNLSSQGTDDVISVTDYELANNDLYSLQQSRIEKITIQKTVNDSKYKPSKEPSTEEFSKEQLPVELSKHETDVNISDNYNNLDKSAVDDFVENSYTVTLPKDSCIIESTKPSTNITSPVIEHLYDFTKVDKNETDSEANVSSEIHKTENLKVSEDDEKNEDNSSEDDDDDDDFIDVEAQEHVEVLSASSDSNISYKHPLDKNSSPSELELKSVVYENESIDKQSTEYTSAQESISSEVEDDDLTIDDDMLREKADRLTRQAQSTTTRCISEAQDLLRLFGFPFVVSPEEAEAQCVALQRYGLVDVVASDDSDVWPFGGRLICRHLFGTGDDKKRKTGPSLYKLDEVKQKLGLTVENILRLTLLCGSDYTRGIDQVGPVTAIEIISEFGEADNSLSSDIDNWLHGICEPSEELLQNILKPLEQFTNWWQTTRSQESPESKKTLKIAESSPVRRRWINLKPLPGFPDSRIARAYLYPNVKVDIPPFKWEAPSVPLLIQHVNNSLGWSRDKTEALLTSVLKHRQTVELGSPEGMLSSNSLITNFFPIKDRISKASEVSNHHIDSSELDEVSMPSKRVRHAANRLRTRKIDESSFKPPIISTSVAETDNLLSELPKPGKSGRRRNMKCLTSETNEKSAQVKNLSKKKSLKKSQVKSKRRVMEKVSLSEEDD